MLGDECARVDAVEMIYAVARRDHGDQRTQPRRDARPGQDPADRDPPAAPDRQAVTVALDRLAALVIECRRARFSITRGDAPDSAIARAEVEGMQPLERRVRLERLDEAELLAEELRLLGRDRTFESALHMAAVICQ